jgi:WD40 repeat protein
MSFDVSNTDAAPSEDFGSDLPALVASLIYSLRARGLTADTRQAVAVEKLLKSLPWQDPGFDLAAHLGPIFCRSQDEQRRFRSIVSELSIVAGSAASKKPPEAATTKEKATPHRRSVYIKTLALILVLAAIVFSIKGFVKPSPTVVDPGPPPGPGPVDPGGANQPSPFPPPAGISDVEMLAYQRVMLQSPLAGNSNWSWAWSAVPLTTLLVWIWFSRARKAHLVRERTDVPPIFKEVRLPGGPREPFSQLRVRDLSRSLRIRQRVASRELDIDATINRTLANGGRPSLVFESFSEPRYLVLIDRTGANDHFGRISEELFNTLQSGNVDCEAYEFEGSPIYCNLPANRRRASGRFRFRLTEILDSQPDRPLLIFSDGAGFLSPFSDSPPEWFSWVNDRQRVLVTPASDLVDWTAREQQLRRHGFHVVPMTPAGIPEVATVLQGLESPRRLPRRFSLPFESETERCLSIFEPSAEFTRTLCRQLKEHLKNDGYRWLASLAAYPEIHWGLTLRFGAALIPDDERWELLVPRMLRLVWLRHGYMPDWFREALLASLPDNDQAHIRQLLMQFLSVGQSLVSVDDKAVDPTDIPLKIAMEQPVGLWNRVKTWLVSFRQVKYEAQQSVDYVYLRFLSGRGPQWLAPFVPAPLLKLLFPQGAWVQGPRIWLVAAACLVLSIAGFAGIEWYRERVFQITSMEVSRDGSLIVTKYRDGRTKLWSHSTPLLALRGHTGQVLSAKFNQDGTRIVTASDDKTARVWDVATGKLLQTFTHDEVVAKASFNPDGTRIVTTSNKTARIWNVSNGQVGQTFKFEAYVNSARFSPDGTKIVTASNDQTARIWDSATGKAIGEPLKHDSMVWSASFSPNGKYVVTAGWDKTARVWDANTGASLYAPLTHDSDVMDASFNADNTRIVTSCDYDSYLEPLYAQLWAASSGSPIGPRLRHDGGVLVAAFSPNGKWVITGSEDGTARLWDAATSLPYSSPLIHESWVRNASFSEDSTRVITGDDQSARVWDVSTGNLLLLLRHTGKVNDARFSPDATKIVTASDDGIVRIWDCRQDRYELGVPRENPCVAMSTDGYRRGVQTSTGDVTVYERDKTDPVFRLPASEKGSVYLLSDQGSPHETILVVGHAGRIEMHDWGDSNGGGTIKGQLKEPIGAVWGTGGSIIFWDAQGLACIHFSSNIKNIPIPVEPVGYAQSENRRFLAIWGKSGDATVIETKSGISSKMDTGKRHRQVVFHPNRPQLFTWDDSGNGDLVDIRLIASKTGTMNLVQSCPYYGTKPVLAAGFSRAGQVLHVHTQDGNLSFYTFDEADKRSSNLSRLRPAVVDVKQVLWGDQENMAIVFNNGEVRLWEGLTGLATSDPLPTSGKVTLAKFGKAAPPEDKPAASTAMFSVAPQDKAESKSDLEPALKQPDQPANGVNPAAGGPANNPDQGNMPPPEGNPPPTPVHPPNRQALVLVTESGNLEVFDINNSGRGVALLIVGPVTSYPSVEIDSLQEVLGLRFGFKVTVLKSPTKREVQQEWNRLQAAVDPQDRFLMILSGNGGDPTGTYAFEVAAGPDRGQPDGDAQRAVDDRIITGAEIRDFMNSVRVSQSLLIVDTNNAGLLIGQPAPPSLRGSLPRCQQVIAAAGKKDEAWRAADRQKLLTPLRKLLKGIAPLAGANGSMTYLDGPCDSQLLFDSLVPLIEKVNQPSRQSFDGEILFGAMADGLHTPGSQFYFPEPRYVLPRNDDSAAKENSKADVNYGPAIDPKKADIKPEDAKAASAKPEDVKPIDLKAK